MFEKMPLFAFALALLAFPSCRKEIPFDDPGTESKIVVDALLGSDRVARIKLSRSISAIENLYDNLDSISIDGASLALTYQGNEVPLTLEFPGVYVSAEELTGAGEISLIATHPEYEPVSANSIIPSPIPIQNPSSQLISSNNGGEAVEISFSITDPPGLGDYYHLMILSESYGGFFNPIGFYSTSSYLTNDSAFGVDEGSYYFENAHFSDELFDGETINMTLEVEPYYVMDTWKIHLVKASEEYHKHLVSRIAFNNARGNFFAQPVQIFENIDQGHGILGGYSVSEAVVE